MKYKSHEYWNRRLKPNKHNVTISYEEKAILMFLDDDNILDFGCGIGRTFKLYEGKVTGLDFSKIYATQARSAAKHLDYTHIVHNVHEEPLPFKDNEFNKGLAIKVLLHAPDDEAVTIIKELGRVCKEVMIIAVNTDKKMANHCFSRSYKELVESLGFEVVKYEYAEKEEQDIIIYR